MTDTKDLTRLKMVIRILDQMENYFGKLDPDQTIVKPLMISGNDECCDVLQMEIDPATLGPFAPAITEMQVKVTAGICKRGNGHLEYDYEYHHPDGGRNGKTVKKVFTTEGQNDE